LDRITDHFGELRIAQFDRSEKIRPVIRRWRNQWADKPRTADYGVQVLSRVLPHAVDPLGKIAGNPCEGIKQLYSNDRSEIIWTDSDIATLKKICSDEVANVVDLAAHTGLRLSDVLRLSWSHVGEDAITFATGKSRGSREAIIPLYDDLHAVLARIPKRATTILTSSKRRPWTPDGFGSSFTIAKKVAGIADKDLHFHDLRGTAATKFYIAGLSMQDELSSCHAARGDEAMDYMITLNFLPILNRRKNRPHYGFGHVFCFCPSRILQVRFSDAERGVVAGLRDGLLPDPLILDPKSRTFFGHETVITRQDAHQIISDCVLEVDLEQLLAGGLKNARVEENPETQNARSPSDQKRLLQKACVCL
jgi:hypothetical protein